jgi:phage terminase large subunit-like protein
VPVADPPVSAPFSPGYRGFLRFAEAVGLRLEPFQRKIARTLFAGQRETLVLLPRGNGKSTLLGAVAVHHLLTVDRAAIYVAAASRDQARVVFEYARDFATHRAVAESVVVRHLELRAPGRGHLRVLASDAALLHGLTPSLAIVDELHSFRDDSVYLALRTAMLKRPDARMGVVSTAGQGADTPLGRLRARALALPEVRRSGPLTEAVGPGLAMLEWSAHEDADVEDPAVAKAVNPASWLRASDLAEQRAAVPDSAFRRFHLGQWVAREGSWLPAGAWQRCVGEPSFEDGEQVTVGVDVGGERSASAVVWVNSALHVGCAIFHGDEGVLECVDLVRELAGRYRVSEVAFDPWRFAQAAQELERERMTVVAFPQSDSRMIPASDRLYRAVVEKRLTLPPDPEFARHAADGVARHGRRGWRIDKAERSTNVDAVVALAMAVERAEARPEPARVLGWL